MAMEDLVNGEETSRFAVLLVVRSDFPGEFAAMATLYQRGMAPEPIQMMQRVGSREQAGLTGRGAKSLAAIRSCQIDYLFPALPAVTI
jgi:hypothetical protein